MEFGQYRVEDFVCDETFQEYCLQSNSNSVDFWDRWISSNPSKYEEAMEAKQIIALLSARQGNLRESISQLRDGIMRFDHLKHTISNRDAEIRHQALSAGSVNTRMRRSGTAWKYIGIAASLLLLAFAGWYISSQKISPTVPERVVSLQSTPITSGTLNRKTIVLPDGSVVTLHKNSTIILSSAFDKNDRNITLTGEAFFDVTHKPLPFIVHTPNLNVEVVGTAFNVSAYPQLPSETSLFRGKIVISVNDDSERRIVLSPNQKFILHQEKGKKILEKNKDYRVTPLSVDPADQKPRETAWLRNRLVIEDESLETIAEKLKQWYGIQISFADDESKTYRYSGTFETETVMKALEALQLSYPFSFRVEDNRIIISK